MCFCVFFFSVGRYTFRSDSYFLSPFYHGDPSLEYEEFFGAGIDGVFSDFADQAVTARNGFLFANLARFSTSFYTTARLTSCSTEPVDCDEPAPVPLWATITLVIISFILGVVLWPAVQYVRKKCTGQGDYHINLEDDDYNSVH